MNWFSARGIPLSPDVQARVDLNLLAEAYAAERDGGLLPWLDTATELAWRLGWRKPGQHPRRGDRGMTDLDRTSRQLREIPALYDTLALFRLPGSLPADPDRRSGTTNPSRPPTVLTVVDLTDVRTKAGADHTRTDYDLDRRAGSRRQGILPTLGSWSRLIDGELWDESIKHDPPSESPTVATECAFLLEHLAWFGGKQQGGELIAEVESIHRDLRAATGSPEEGKRWPCPDCSNFLEPQGGDQAVLQMCRSGCGRLWRLKELQDRVERIDRQQGNYAENAVTIAHAARAVGRSVSTVKEWVQRGDVVPLGFDRQRNAALVPLDRVRDLADKAPRRKRTAA